MKHSGTGYCSNVKLTIKLSQTIVWVNEQDGLVDHMSSNIIIRSGAYTLTQYKKDKSCLHVTGVRNFGRINKLCIFLSKRLTYTVDEIAKCVNINCSTWHANVHHPLDLWSLFRKLPAVMMPKYIPTQFAGLTCKSGRVTVIIFSTGKMNFFGVKREPEYHSARINILFYVYS